MNTFDPSPFTPEGPTPLIREMPEAAPFPVSALGPLRDPSRQSPPRPNHPLQCARHPSWHRRHWPRRGIGTRRRLNGTAPASLFLLTVAESGERKSTADRLAMRGVRDFEADLRTDYDIERDLWRDAHEVWKATRALKDLGTRRPTAQQSGPICKPLDRNRPRP